MGYYLKNSDRIYLSGPISKDPAGARRRFAQIQRYLNWKGYPNVINPELVFRSVASFSSHAELLHDCKTLIEKNADVVLLLPGWKNSPGANMEVGMASVLGKPVLEIGEDGYIKELKY